MNKKLLLILWAGLFSLCAGLGFIPEPAGLMGSVMTFLSVAVFLPPFLLLYQAIKTGSTYDICLIRNLSALSLGLTAVLLVLNFLTALRSELLGTVIHYVLVTVSSPMICSGHWALSLFLWACLLMVSLSKKK